jgi:hypothetical protein
MAEMDESPKVINLGRQEVGTVHEEKEINQTQGNIAKHNWKTKEFFYERKKKKGKGRTWYTVA